ncbi:LD29223p [Strongyloides ratti]|uniref:LD29223p n=1 Tax=Strongyloides ratti TaxID=34506 RepID=A0A090LAY5_STRRB|nr:LD29223p [Strongyloides ratti]CEF65268.1 LD29223p [Strongyloides ratti]
MTSIENFQSEGSPISMKYKRTNTNKSGNSITYYQPQLPPVPDFIAVKSKFDAEFRRFIITFNNGKAMTYEELRSLLEQVHHLQEIPFIISYTSNSGDTLPITNDENFRKSYESAKPALKILIQRKGESLHERYGYGMDTLDRKRKGISSILTVTPKPQRLYSISNPADFRQVSAIIDVDIIPDTLRRIRISKHGNNDRALGFYIRNGKTVRISNQNVIHTNGIFISRLLEGGLAESTGLLAVNDEVLEVNGISVDGKNLDQVTDMMVANAENLILTVKPAHQTSVVNRNDSSYNSNRTNSNSSFSVGEMHENKNNKSGEYTIIHRKNKDDDTDSSDDEMFEYDATVQNNNGGRR